MATSKKVKNVKPKTTIVPTDNLCDEYVFLGGGKTSAIRPYFLCGVLMQISKGEEFDVLTVKTSDAKKECYKSVLVYNNHARRQIYTCRKGQSLISYGLSALREIEITYRGKKRRVMKRFFWANMIQGMYVPKSLDIKHDVDYQENQVDTMSIEQKEYWEDTINSLLDGTIETKVGDSWRETKKD